jgi:hypothetical protein
MVVETPVISMFSLSSSPPPMYYIHLSYMHLAAVWFYCSSFLPYCDVSVGKQGQILNQNFGLQ